MTIQRYRAICDEEYYHKTHLDPEAEGDLVRFEDHEREVDEFRKLLAEWRKEHRADHPRRDGCDLCKRTDEVLGR